MNLNWKKNIMTVRSLHEHFLTSWVILHIRAMPGWGCLSCVWWPKSDAQILKTILQFPQRQFSLLWQRVSLLLHENKLWIDPNPTITINLHLPMIINFDQEFLLQLLLKSVYTALIHLRWSRIRIQFMILKLVWTFRNKNNLVQCQADFTQMSDGSKQVRLIPALWEAGYGLVLGGSIMPPQQNMVAPSA